MDDKALLLFPRGSVNPWIPVHTYGFAILAVGICTGVCFFMFPFFELTNLVMVYLLGTLIVSARGYRGPAILSCILSVLCFNFFFVPPRFTFRVADAQYIVTFAVMFVAAMIISHLTVRLYAEAEAARQGQMRTSIVHAFAQRLAITRGLEKVLHAAAIHMEEVFGASVVTFLPDKEGHLEAKMESNKLSLNDKEYGLAQWVYDRGQSAGLGTTSLPDADALYIPLRGAEGSVGVLRLKPLTRQWHLTPEQSLLLDSFAHQIALALEVDRLEESTKKAEVETETERLRNSLLSSVSHDFRTPLTAIVGSASTLLQKEDLCKNCNNPAARELLENIQTEAERLSRLVQNLLEVTRLESGALRLKKELYPFEEVVGSALACVEKSMGQREIIVAIQEDLPLVPLYSTLVEQVLINLLENAIRHTPSQSRIEIKANAQAGSICVTVADEGAGLKKDEFDRVFDKFYREKSSPGAGLGLAICRAVVNVHGGKIWADNQPGHGAIFYFTLPLEETSHGS